MPTYYSSQTLVESRLSAAGVTLRLDDGASGAMADVLADADTRINFYLLRRYEAAQLTGNAWVTYRATDVAVYLLCRRRANPVPKSVQAAYDETVEMLERVEAGKALVPGATPRKPAAPVLSQPRIELWPQPHAAIERERSTGQAEGYPRHDAHYEPPL